MTWAIKTTFPSVTTKVGGTELRAVSWNEHLAEYYTPRNFNFWYFFGSLAMLVLVMQIVTGVFLTMHFKPDELKEVLFHVLLD
jgi:quinol-cytochrome oxidoreductase complex cytochrome b subunit